jgi:hypothetical protein
MPEECDAPSGAGFMSDRRRIKYGEFNVHNFSQTGFQLTGLGKSR